MTTLAHISDLHFGREEQHLIDGLINSLESIQPEMIIVSGDITQRARKDEFRAARVFFGKLPWPLCIISGNHDIPFYNLADRFFDPWRKWHRNAKTVLEPVKKGKNFIVIGINTARRSGSLLNWSRGRVNKEQIQAVERLLAQADQDQLRLIAAHHPFWLPDEYQHRRLIGGRDAAVQVFKEAGVDLLLSGHVHSAYTHILSGIIVCHAGTAVSNRLDKGAKNSFRVIRGDRKKLTIEKREWLGRSFELSEELLFRRTQGEWRQDAAKT